MRKTVTLRRALLGGVCTLLGLGVSGVAALLVYMTIRPIDITPVVRPFLPVALINSGTNRPPLASLSLDRAELRWNGLHDGLTSPLAIVLYNITLQGPARRTDDTIREARVMLDPLSLLRGTIGLRSASLRGVRITLRRKADGSTGPDFDLPANMQSPGGGNSVDIGKLEHIRLDDAVITVNDQMAHTRWVVSPLSADLSVRHRNRHQGLVGTASIGLSRQDGTSLTRLVTLSANGAPVGHDGAITWRLLSTPVSPAALSALAPQLKTVDIPTALTADTRLVPAAGTNWLLPDGVNLNLGLGAGRMVLAGSTYTLDHGAVALGLTLDRTAQGSLPAHLVLHDTSLSVHNADVPQGPDHTLELELAGQLTASDLLHPQGISGQVTANIAHVAFEDMHSYWPEHAAKGGKKWVADNITSGDASGLQTTLSLAGTKGWDTLKVVGLDGGLAAKGLTIHWLRPVSPLHDITARLAIHDLNTLIIDFDNGYQLVDRAGKNVGLSGTGRIEAGPGRMTITGLSQRDQTGIITSKLTGRLEDILALLAEDRLHLLSRHPISITNPRGKAEVNLSLSLPLVSHVRIDDMTINAHADVSHAMMGNVVAGRSVTNGHFELDATTQGLTLSGGGVIGGLPANVTYLADFSRVGPQAVLEQAHMTSRLTPQSLAAAGYDPGEHFNGTADLDVAYRETEDHHATVDVGLDLGHARILIPLWHKAPDQQARVSARLALVDGHIVGVDRIVASGPDLEVKGQAAIRPHMPPELIVSSFRIARSSGHARLALPTGSDSMIHVGVYADTLDLSPLVTGDPATQQPTTQAPAGYHIPEAATGRLHGPAGTAWAIDLTADTLWYNATKPSLRGVKAYFEHNGRRLRTMRFTMRGPTPVSMSLTPQGNSRSLDVTIPDLGTFLSAFNILPDVEGGHAVLTGTFDDSQATAPFKGKINVSPFTLKKAPTALRVARNISVYGWLWAQNTDAFEITHMSLPVTFEGDVLSIHDGSIGNTALGATLEGAINLSRNNIDLHGTVAPVFAVNKLPGKLPGIGRVFSPEKDGGVVAMTFGISGKLDNPGLHFNPFSILLPGVLRNML
ncbi:AsmA-like C-terminal region-containing protein [Acetobacter garciniae]|uniref:AsmA-like C-terminal region-containing protein n=1 Tax=Acetobacter garciniae TaxID=2817435 RepID=UPI002ED8BC56